MIFFKINSKTLSKNPTTYKSNKTKVQKSDRTMDGTLVVDIITHKDTITFTWDYLPDADLRLLIKEVTAKSFCTIEFLDAQSEVSGALRSMVAQPGDISYTPYYDYASDSILWKGVSVAFTER